MSTFARLIAGLLGVAVAACAFLPWVAELTAWHLHLRTLLTPGDNLGVTYVTSVGLLVTVSGGLIALGALLNRRAIVILGGLGAIGVPAVWILANAVSQSGRAVPVSQIQIGAYAGAILGFMTLVLAAVAIDTRVPTLR